MRGQTGTVSRWFSIQHLTQRNEQCAGPTGAQHMKQGNKQHLRRAAEQHSGKQTNTIYLSIIHIQQAGTQPARHHKQHAGQGYQRASSMCSERQTLTKARWRTHGSAEWPWQNDMTEATPHEVASCMIMAEPQNSGRAAKQWQSGITLAKQQNRGNTTQLWKKTAQQRQRSAAAATLHNSDDAV